MSLASHNHIVLRRLLHRLAHGGGVELELIDGVAVGERVDPGRAVGPAHDLCLARPVVDTFQRIGQRLALEVLRVRQHVPDGLADQLGVVERQLDIRPQYSFALADDHLPGGFLRHASPRDELPGLCLDERLARLRHLWREPLALFCPEPIEPRLLDDR